MSSKKKIKKNWPKKALRRKKIKEKKRKKKNGGRAQCHLQGGHVFYAQPHEWE
jgi:hypothetical protein